MATKASLRIQSALPRKLTRGNPKLGVQITTPVNRAERRALAAIQRKNNQKEV